MVIFLVLFSFCAHGQKDSKSIREGNELFHKRQYEKATEKYAKALEKEKHVVTLYNQGTAQYKNNKLDEAISSLQASINSPSSPDQKAKAHYNLGDAYYKKDQFDQSINQFKSVLNYDPKDEDAKRNLLIAKMKKKQMEAQQKKDDKDKNDKEKESKDSKPKENDQKKENNDEKNQDNPNNKNEANNNRNKSGQQQKLSNDEMKRLTEFIEGEDQKVQEKLQRVSKSSHKPLKDW